MKQYIYHTGLTSPPSINIKGFKICHYPVLDVGYESINVPQDISDYLQLDPIVIMMSKNAVIGLDIWLTNFGLDIDYFADSEFWTVGDRTHGCLKNILKIQSFYPEEMTGIGVLQALQKENHSRILLISGQDPRKEFIEGLSSAGINFFHFSVYKTFYNNNADIFFHFQNIETNYLIITSPSAVSGILESLSYSDMSKLKTRIISIGPTTSAAIRQNGGDVFLQSEFQNLNVLYNTLEDLIFETYHSK